MQVYKTPTRHEMGLKAIYFIQIESQPKVHFITIRKIAPIHVRHIQVP